MKVTVNEDNKASDVKYPCLMIANDGDILLATKEGDVCLTGTVVARGDGASDIGHHCTGWAKSCFKPFNGSITLSND